MADCFGEPPAKSVSFLRGRSGRWLWPSDCGFRSNRVSMSAACSESERLLNAYGTAVQELFMFQEQHFAALVDGDEDPTRYELLIHMAGEKRQAAKYAYLRHVEEHGCEKAAQEAVAEFAHHI